MLSKFKIIESDTLIDINNHFKVYAGPGAGKTYWLIKHILNVLRTSNKLCSVSKVACITYTNAATNVIEEKLIESIDKVEVSTIHSFLYNNIVKPYAYLLVEETGINFGELDWHHEHRISEKKLINAGLYLSLKDNLKKTKDENTIIKKQFLNYLSRVSWKLNTNGKFVLTDDRNNIKLLKYKQEFWKEGIIHHDDVLFFAYKILQNHKLLRLFLSKKFPYIFIDEFQDTNPIQTQIIKWLADKGSLIGVIGDIAQSIYMFQNAELQDFINFELPELINYKIENNRRSTQNIINLLNHVRKDDPINQNCSRNCSGDIPKVIIGDDNKILEFFNSNKDLYPKSCIVSRSNQAVIKLKSACSCSLDIDIWDKFKEKNSYKERFYHGLLLAEEYAYQKKYELAIKELVKVIKPKEKNGDPLTGRLYNEIEKRSLALKVLNFLINNRSNILNGSLFALNQLLVDLFQPLRFSSIRSGEIKTFFEGTPILELICNLKIEKDNSNIRTVHGTKGDEFDFVLMHLKDEKELKYILSNNIITSEECRIRYVGLSRAKNFLCISSPTISEENKKLVENLGLEIINLN